MNDALAKLEQFSATEQMDDMTYEGKRNNTTRPNMSTSKRPSFSPKLKPCAKRTWPIFDFKSKTMAKITTVHRYNGSGRQGK